MNRKYKIVCAGSISLVSLVSGCINFEEKNYCDLGASQIVQRINRISRKDKTSVNKEEENQDTSYRLEHLITKIKQISGDSDCYKIDDLSRLDYMAISGIIIGRIVSDKSGKKGDYYLIIKTGDGVKEIKTTANSLTELKIAESITKIGTTIEIKVSRENQSSFYVVPFESIQLHKK